MVVVGFLWQLEAAAGCIVAPRETLLFQSHLSILSVDKGVSDWDLIF